ncbi:MAG: aminotransferase class I/II-fold pyridoxal phosphate-dependent enzyme [Spirochaetaceae bacterium]|jgi:threonine-phosphate decarboxylase|nr:aminotransferase class I/II-fold pyridoxal phosphate-dependent enzyme [Spirochaetaceae bacterium]
MEIRHGGIDYLKSETPVGGGRLIDFSVNINPLGLPKAIVDALLRELRGELRGEQVGGAKLAENFSKYPDPFCRELRRSLAECLSVPADRIVCGNGAGDLIYRIAHWKKPARALVTAPAFLDYEKALREISCDVDYHELSKVTFELDQQILSKINSDIQLLFLGSPGNPSGLTINADLLARIIQKCDEYSITLVIDECFNEFLDAPAEHTAIPYLKNSPNLIILRAFTKIYAMAGLRLGYCVTGCAENAREIANTGQAWPVSAAAQTAGIAALGEKDYVINTRALIKAERARMRDEFTRLGLEVLGGEANFIFFRIRPDSGFDNDVFFDNLLQYNILIRRCDNYRGLDDSYYRTAILTHDENTLLLQALAEIKGRRGV